MAVAAIRPSKVAIWIPVFWAFAERIAHRSAIERVTGRRRLSKEAAKSCCHCSSWLRRLPSGRTSIPRRISAKVKTLTKSDSSKVVFSQRSTCGSGAPIRENSDRTFGSRRKWVKGRWAWESLFADPYLGLNRRREAGIEDYRGSCDWRELTQWQGSISLAKPGQPGQSLRREKQNDPVVFLPGEAVLFLGGVPPSYHQAKRICGGMQIRRRLRPSLNLTCPIGFFGNFRLVPLERRSAKRALQGKSKLFICKPFATFPQD